MSIDMGFANTLGADAVGQPGQRRFRLFTQSASASAIMWMEKQQLSTLSIALDHSLALITEGQVLRTEAQSGVHPLPQGMPSDFPPHPTYEIQVGQMKLNYDEADGSFVLNVVPFGVVMEGDQAPEVFLREEETLVLFFTPRQAQQLSATITTVVTAGRPVCPLCHAPLDGGPHACVKQNGHREIIPIEENGGGEE